MMITRFNRMGLRYTLSVVHNGDNTESTQISHKGKSIIVNYPLERISESWYIWQNKNIYKIQDAFGYLNADEREFLMTGITKEEWDKLFPEE